MNRKAMRWTMLVATTACFAGGPLMLSGCDRTESKTKTTTTKVTETPDAVKKTVETTEKKVEKSP